MTEAIDFALYLEKFLGEVPGGADGDREMRRRLPGCFIDTTDEDIRPDRLTDEQIASYFGYAAWNLWDVIHARSSEGESGLIPRQEYETVGFLQAWSNYPRFLRELTEEVGVDGLVEIGRTPRREVGTKIAQNRNWALPLCPLLGRGIAVELGIVRPDERREDVEAIIQVGRRVAHGTWGGGSTLVSGRGFRNTILDDDVLQTLLAEVRELSDPGERAAFRRFNASTELFGFLIHYDCRAGMSDSGPYWLPDGRFAIVRDHFLYDPVYPWADVAVGLPYALTEVMVFRPDGPIEVIINDLVTTFSKPANYLRFLEGAAVFARDRHNTPMSELRVLGTEEMQSISTRSEEGVLALYRQLAALDRDQLIRNGVMVYNREFLMPVALRAGLTDRFVSEGFDDFHEEVLEAWPILTGGQAAEILAPVFIAGRGFPPVSA